MAFTAGVTDIRKVRIAKGPFGVAVKDLVNTTFGTSFVNGDFDQDNPPILDPDDASLVLITLKERTTP